MKKLLLLMMLSCVQIQANDPLVVTDLQAADVKNDDELHDNDDIGVQLFGGSILGYGVFTLNIIPCLIGLNIMAIGDICYTSRLAIEKKARQTVCQDIKKSMTAMLLDKKQYPLLMQVFTQTDCDEELHVDDVDKSALSIVIKGKKIHLFYHGVAMKQKSIPIDASTGYIITESLAKVMESVEINKIKIYRQSSGNIKNN